MRTTNSYSRTAKLSQKSTGDNKFKSLIKKTITSELGPVTWILKSSRPLDNLYLVEVKDIEVSFYIVNVQTRKLMKVREGEGSGFSFDSKNYVPITAPSTSVDKWDVKKRLAEILKLPTTQGWNVVDNNGDLYLVHYDEDYQSTELIIPRFPSLRGVLVDITTGLIIASSYGYTPIVTSNNLIIKDNNYIFKSGKKEWKLNVTSTTIAPVFDGVVLRVVKYAGKIYYVSNRKIITEKSHWGKSKSFRAMYTEAGGPSPSDLFSDDCDYSPWCYIFLVVHSDLIVATRQIVSAPYLVHLGTQKLWEQGPYQKIEYQDKSNFLTSSELHSQVTKSFIYRSGNWNLQQAQEFLNHGYYNPSYPLDDRMSTGEALFLYDSSSNILLKVHSRSYHWRWSMRGEDPNLLHRLYLLYDSLATGDKTNIFINFTIHSPSILEEAYNRYGSLLDLPLSNKKLESSNEMWQLVWINFLFSLPIQQQKECFQLITRIQQDLDDLLEWLLNLISSRSNLKSPEYIPPVSWICQNCISNLKHKRVNIRDSKHLRSTLSNLLEEESGPNLYQMVRCMRKVNI